MTIAVIGAAGFIGSRLVESTFLTGQVTVVPVVRSLSGAMRLARFGKRAVVANAENADELANVISNCDVVVNLTSGDSRRLMVQLEGIYEACVRQKVQTLIHLSSAVVFGEVRSPVESEDDVPQSVQDTVYASQKAQCERFLHSKIDGPVRLVTLRPGLVWGPKSPWLLAPLNDLNNDRAYLVGGGTGACNLAFVDNLVTCIVAAATNENPTPGFYNIRDQDLTWREYYSSLASMLGKDLTNVTLFADEPFRPSFTDRVLAIRETRLYDSVKRRLPNQFKARVRARWRQHRESWRLNSSTDAGPHPSREIWSLQRTRHHLPAGQFKLRFGTLAQEPYDVALRRSASWAAFAGFDVRC